MIFIQSFNDNFGTIISYCVISLSLSLSLYIYINIYIYIYIYIYICMYVCMYLHFFLSIGFDQWGVTLAQLVKLLSCDWKGTSSSLRNSILCKKQGKVAYNTPIMWDPVSDPAYAGALVHQIAPFLLVLINKKKREKEKKLC